ncbi:hypothetical protein, partial [Klebsiella pneumoniae]|uniref:hypothetical protein n=1 Tax=Klebsiella pneumoniae TaxID=573 RepID=UPI001B30E2C4
QNNHIDYNWYQIQQNHRLGGFEGLEKAGTFLSLVIQLVQTTRLRFVSKKLTHNSQKVKYPSIAIPKKNPSVSSL